MQTQAPPPRLTSTGVTVLLAILAGHPLWRATGDTGLRIFNAIEHYRLGIVRAVFTAGADTHPYIRPFGAQLFLSANPASVRSALEHGAEYFAGLVHLRRDAAIGEEHAQTVDGATVQEGRARIGIRSADSLVEAAMLQPPPRRLGEILACRRALRLPLTGHGCSLPAAVPSGGWPRW